MKTLEYLEQELSKEYGKGYRRYTRLKKKQKGNKKYRQMVVLPLWRLAVVRKALLEE